jgi:hypothetical protein
MIDKDEKLERYLAEFQPRPIRNLKIPAELATIRLRRLAAAAVLVFGIGIGLWLAHQGNAPAVQIAAIQQPEAIGNPPFIKLNGVALTRLALENSQEFDAYLLFESRNVLPDLQGEKSTLRVLVMH